jgi:RNA polymerase sigma-70 factor (ECF subfamily)
MVQVQGWDGLADLVQRIEDGDAAAEGELVARFQHGLGLMLRRLAQDGALAEDLCQETFCLVIEKLRRREVREPERLAGFIRSTAYNLFIADRRRERRYEQGGGREPLPDGAAAHHDRAEAAQLREVLREEEAREVRRLLSELRFERDRELLVRFYLGDESKEEVCRRLGVDPRHFHQVLHRARERLRELWERAEGRRRLQGFARRDFR